ncbi:MAG: putative peptidoglycan lipid II flippase [Verrucomicrobiales bacterium]|jgi:putative peptidoglycan lipid II flippase
MRRLPDPAQAPKDAPGDPPPKGKAGIVSIAVMCSRVLGLVREIVLGALFGASAFMDCFIVAYRTPNMLRDLFAEGALSTAFVTTFSKKLKTEGDEAAWELARKMITLAMVFMTILTLVCVLIAPMLVRLMAPGFYSDSDNVAIGMGPLTVQLAQIMYVFIAMVSLAALVMGMLNSKGIFFVPALSSSFFNVFSVATGVAIGYWMDPNWGKGAFIGLAIGVLVGGLAQLAVQLPALWKTGFRFKLDFGWRDSGVKKVLILMGPAVLAGSAVQIGVLINTMFASVLEQGSISSLQWAFRLIMLPIGIFGVAVATVTLPAVARAATEGIGDEFRNVLSRGIRLVGLLTIPSAIGLAMLAEPIIEVVFQRGAFDHDTTLRVAAALRCYAFGLIFYSGLKVIQPTFYAVEKKWVPMFVSLGAIALNAGLNTLWVFVLDIKENTHQYLALSTTISATLNFAVLYILMRRIAGNLQTGKLISTVIRLMIAGAALVGVILTAQNTILPNYFVGGSFVLKVLILGVTIAAAAVSYFVVARLLRVEELDEFMAIVKRRAKR